jgi:hypothetical protein
LSTSRVLMLLLRRRAAAFTGTTTVKSSLVILLGLLCSVLLSPGSGFCQDKGTITISAAPGVLILTPAHPATAENKAAHLLADMLERVVGKRFDISAESAAIKPDGRVIVAVGKTKMMEEVGLSKALAGKPDDSLAIGVWPEKNAICLMGQERLGTLFAASAFLERFAGVHWFFPDELGIVAPAQERFSVAAGVIVESPDFPIRWVGRPPADKWALFNKVNTNQLEKDGVQVFKSAHTFNDFLPVDQYFATHPEYFAFIKGKRRTKQIDTSNPDVIQEVSKNMIQHLKENPFLTVITLFPNDGLGFCECDRCKALDEKGLPTVREINHKWDKLGPERYKALSRRMVVFYLAVGEKVLRAFPNIIIQAGAYGPYNYPPNDRSFKAPSNMMIEIANNGDQNLPIESKASPMNVLLSNAFQGWREIFPKLSVYEYFRRLSMYDLPFPILHAIGPDILFYKQAGVSALFTQFGPDYYTNGLNYYVAAKLLWNSSQDVWKLLDDFCLKFYQEASEPMREYHFNYEKAAMDSGVPLPSPISPVSQIFTPSLLANQTKLLDKAAALAKNKQVQERIQRARVSLEYVKMSMDYVRAAKSVNDGKYLSGTVKLLEAANEIGAFRKKHQDAYCFSTENNYIQRYLNPTKLALEISRRP